jgi:hypothetical protein
MIYPFPHPLLLPLGKVIEHDAIGRKIVRQPSPGATLPHKIKDRLEDRFLTRTRRPPQLAAKWKQVLQNIPFFTISARRAVSQNVWRRSFNGKDAPVQITKYEMHPVRFQSCSRGRPGLRIRRRDLEVGQGSRRVKAGRVKISQGSLLDGPFYACVTSDISELAVSQDGTPTCHLGAGRGLCGRSSQRICISHRDGN